MGMIDKNSLQIISEAMHDLGLMDIWKWLMYVFYYQFISQIYYSDICMFSLIQNNNVTYIISYLSSVASFLS